MSEFLFTHSKVDPLVLRLRLAALGTAGCLLLGLFCGVLGLQALGVLSSDVRATVQLPTVGDTLGINSDVKYNGLRVGRVIEVDARVREAEVLVEPEHADLIPATVHARVLPGTLFGNEYVDLVVPGRKDATRLVAAVRTGAVDEHLSDGAVIPADTSRATLRLMDTFSATQRLLAAVDPEQWDLALSQLAGSLDGRGARLAEMVSDGDAFLARWEGVHPQVRRDLDLLTENADLLTEIEPRLVSAIRDTRPLARTLVEQEEGTTTLLAGVPRLLDGRGGVTAFLRENGDETARLLNATAANLEVFAARYPSFALLLSKVPALLRNGAAAVKNDKIQMEGVLATKFYDAYDAEDCPAYRGLAGPCRGGR
jgi:phospholipid/cholesterol/gamma-HCH transport system substrate-binding protein